MASNAAEALAWAPLADAPAEQVVRLPRYPSVEECVEEQPEDHQFYEANRPGTEPGRAGRDPWMSSK